MSSLRNTPEGEQRLFRFYVIRYFAGSFLDETFQKLGPYATKRKAQIIADRRTILMRSRGELEPGESYGVEAVQYAGPGTLPENAA